MNREPMVHRVMAAVGLAIFVAACGGGLTLSDADRVWCAGQPMAVLTAADTLKVTVPQDVRSKAEAEARSQARTVGDILRDVANGVTATGPLSSMNAESPATWDAAWEKADAAGFARACSAARGATR